MEGGSAKERDENGSTAKVGQRVQLVFGTFQRLPLKDFGAEVRAPLDVSRFLLQQSAVLLDVTENEPERLIGLLLSHMVPDLDKDEARSVLFTQENGQ